MYITHTQRVEDSILTASLSVSVVVLCSVGETVNRSGGGFSGVPVAAVNGTIENPSLGSCYARGSVPAATSAPSPSPSPSPSASAAMDNNNFANTNSSFNGHELANRLRSRFGVPEKRKRLPSTRPRVSVLSTSASAPASPQSGKSTGTPAALHHKTETITITKRSSQL